MFWKGVFNLNKDDFKDLENMIDMSNMRVSNMCNDNDIRRNNNCDNMPIAMAYVPWQKWKSTYDPEKALERGTIFPELDLPFSGGDRND